MKPLLVVETLKISVQVASRLRASAPRTAMDQLTLERPKEALGDSVIPAIAFPTHAAHKTRSSQMLLIDTTGILTAAVRMVQQAGLHPTAPQGHAEGTESQIGL